MSPKADDEPKTPLVYADFQKLDDDDRLVLTTLGTRRDLELLNIVLREGLCLRFYDDGDGNSPLVVEGVVQKDERTNRWVAEVDWNSLERVAGMEEE